jgi:hypothetical protein
MNIQNWKIFDKSGSLLNLYADAYLPLTFTPSNQNATGASGYAITDPSNYIIKGINGVKITNSGWGYTGLQTDPQIQLNSSFTDYTHILLSPSEVSIGFKDVSIFNPDPGNSKAIESVLITLVPDVSFLYPSISFSSAIFLNPISQGLVETEHLTIIEETSPGLFISPNDPDNSILVFRFTDGDPEIKLFEIDEHEQLLSWSDELVVDVSRGIVSSGLMINIGFRSDNEGVYERRLRVYHRVGTTDYLIAEILINAESIGPDERFDTLITNFGLPSPKATPILFKEADINEALPDWKLLNQKSKHMILEHDKIMPYIGTYKALINAIKWLGYDDISVKEWYRNVKERTKLSLTVPYDAAERTKTILYFSPEERRNLKKLNQLSLVYCLTRETGEIDEWGNPLTEDCYSYNLNEILIKLYALKQWLERWIIGVNARITDITGEGIYFERYQNFIYATQNIGIESNYRQSVSPYVLAKSTELVAGDASMALTLEELRSSTVQNLPMRAIDFIKFAWNPSYGYFDITDTSALLSDSSTIFIGPSAQFPLVDLFDIQWKLSVEKTDSGVVTNNLVTKPLWIYDNEIRFFNVLDTSSQFYDNSNLNILLEKAYLKDADPSNDIWEDSIAYSIYSDPCTGGYWIDNSAGFHVWQSFDYVNLVPDTNSKLIYEFDANYRVPLLSFENYKFTDASDNVISLNKKYFLDIIDGKIMMDSSILGIKDWVTDPSTAGIENLETTINWNYDSSLGEQKITLNVVYRSPRMPLYIYDPSAYYWSQGSDPSIAKVVDNQVYLFRVNHTGDFHIELYAWDGFNNIFTNQMEYTHPVWTKFPRIYSLVDSSNYLTYEVSTFMNLNDVSALISANRFPLFDKYIPLQGLSLEFDPSGDPYITIPSITYFQDLPETDSLNRFINLTERVVNIAGSTIEIDPDYQKFYTGDDIQLVKFDKGKYHLTLEASAHIASSSSVYPGSAQPTLAILDQIPVEITIDASSELYILNNTHRNTSNAQNIGSNLILDVIDYQFEPGQLVGVIVSDGSTGYSWGSSYRVIDVSGMTHTFNQNIPQFFIDSSKYTIKIKHAFSTYSDFTIETDHAVEIANNFKIYLKNSYCQEYFLDNTFVVINMLFDQDYVNQQWYDPSDNLVNSTFFLYNEAITVDTSTLVIFKSLYDVSNYMLDQHNVWTVKNHDPNQIIFKVFNDSVPFIFNQIGTYDVQVESFDKYGNLKTQIWEGLIKVQ